VCTNRLETRRGKPIDGSPLQLFVAEIGKRLDVEAVVLFGSRARNEAMAESDYDLAVVSDSFAQLGWGERIALLQEAWEWAPHAEPLGFTKDEFLAVDRHILWEILDAGVPYVDRGTFAEAKRRFESLLESGKLQRVRFGWQQVEDGTV